MRLTSRSYSVPILDLVLPANNAPKKTKSDTSTSTGGSSSSAQFWEFMTHELRLKREAAEKAFEVAKEKDRTVMRLEELKFLAISTNDLRLLKGFSSSSISNGIWSHHNHLKYFSISSSNPKPTHFMVDFLINSLGFTKEAAITTSIYTIHWLKRSSVEKNFRLLRSYGWSQEQIDTFTRLNPMTLGYSENKIRGWLDFFMKQLGYSPVYLVTRSFLLSVSLEKRVKPRYKVYEMLKEKKLVGTRPYFASLVQYPELKFLRFVKRFENELPGLVETYTNSIKKTVKL
nr:mitochodrial transcription termination factor [Tanacetum cinerariifolium]